jgi:hypothetical protein
MLQTSNIFDVTSCIAPCCNRSSDGFFFLIRVIEHGGDRAWRAMGAQGMAARRRSGGWAACGGALVLLHRIGGLVGCSDVCSLRTSGR